MSTLNTPLSTTATPLSSFSLSNLATPDTSRHVNATPSPLPSTSRRSGGHSSQVLSMYSTHDRVILDIGARFIRAGFSGEAFPRCIIDAITKSESQVFWERDHWDPGLIEDRLERGLRQVYSQYITLEYLLIDSKARKVIVAEDTLLPYRIKEAICRVLFTYFQVPSVTFLSSHVLALASTGLRTGLVIDIGWYDTRVLPIYELRPLNPFIQVSPIACKALHSRLHYLLQQYSTPPLTSPSFNEIDDFLVRGLYTLPTPPSYPSSTTGLISNQDLKSTYETDPHDTIQWYLLSQKQTINVPRWICSRTTEIFFEGDRGIRPDTDEIGLATTIITCLLRLPKDVRSKVIEGVVVVGGGAGIPGLRSRLQKDLEMMWEEKLGRRVLKKTTTPEASPPSSSHEERTLSIADLTPKTSKKFFRFVQANPLEATFQGASLLGDIKVKGFVEVHREAFNSSQGRDVRDWTEVGGVAGDDGVEETKRKSRS